MCFHFYRDEVVKVVVLWWYAMPCVGLVEEMVRISKNLLNLTKCASFWFVRVFGGEDWESLGVDGMLMWKEKCNNTKMDCVMLKMGWLTDWDCFYTWVKAITLFLCVGSSIYCFFLLSPLQVKLFTLVSLVAHLIVDFWLQKLVSCVVRFNFKPAFWTT